MTQHRPPDHVAHLWQALVQHCADRGYALGAPETDRHAYLNVQVNLPGPGGTNPSWVRLSLNGEVFALSFPGGYHWTEYSYAPEDGSEAMADVLAFVDAFADPRTHEVEVSRRLRRARTEMRVSNGAVLRRRGWSSGPPDPSGGPAD